MSRRSLFVVGGFIVALTVAASGETDKKLESTPSKVENVKPPVARVEAVKDTYFGETVEDPYRWMENDKDPGWLPFLKAENDYTRKVLDKVPGRDALLKRIEQLSGDTVQTNRLQRARGKLFFQQRPIGADNFKLFVREDPFDKLRAGSRDRVLVDPTKLSAGASHYSLDWGRASPDGTHVVYGLSKDGSEEIGRAH